MPNSDEIPMALDAAQVEAKLSEIPQWDADMDVSTLSRAFPFRDFTQSMNFTNAVAKLAEELNHHPDILVSYDTVTLVLTTHSAGGITEKDFLLASKIDALPESTGRVAKNEPFLAD
jgi:4a-hydroxytetrahydrobiopterin dehydratase